MLYWFKNLDQKDRRKFLKFDIEAFYPSITKELLQRAITFGRQYTSISEEEEETILHCRKGVLVGENGSLWQKKVEPNFDVTMGSYDGGEVAELVGLYLLSKINTILPSGSAGLYRKTDWQL